MVPARPPLPTPCSFPFQPSAGIHTSILTSETALGASVAVTRQKDGRSWIVGAPLAGVNAPDTTAADIILVFGSERSEALLIRLEHESTAAGAAPRAMAASAKATSTTGA